MNSSFTLLLEKYLSGQLTDTEQQRLLELLKEEENQAILADIIDAQMADADITHPARERLQHISYQQLELAIRDMETEAAPMPAQRVVLWRRLKPIAIAASLIAVVSLSVYFLVRRPPAPPAETLAVVVTMEQSTNYTRHIVLPDSSVIILRANSTLHLVEGFNTHTRELELTGEAYFDIHHDATRPFIVHTGTLKTTVLGTAFNITAYPGTRQVTVAVTRGKVKVEDRDKTVALLTPNKEVVYKLGDASAAQQDVDANNLVTTWTKKEVVFESIAFENIASIMSKRYGVAIRFSNEHLKNCHVRTACKGTESLTAMLDLLCTAMNAKYTINDKQEVLISGEGCE